ncbi:ras-related protein Rab-26-like isoform X2 [Micropterus salmoides]|uniref:ras-related protein Rab-26-like isoform X2 n=1 Tax=Micropterus salmoides TaxID=27706 RepID=UPI0018EA78FB|nr:ras-related protein Rab-26-like isoform X2 [Micropterus salmoides]
MSRKKAVKGKGSSKSPKASPSSGRTGKGLAAAAAPSSGLVYPSRPSLSNSGEFYDIAFKVMLVGDSGVGKTCLLVRFKDGAFLAGSFISTVGIDFRNKVMSIDAVKVKLQIWDTAGQERFRSVTHAYYRDANALLLLYDVTNKASFDNIRGDTNPSILRCPLDHLLSSSSYPRHVKSVCPAPFSVEILSFSISIKTALMLQSRCILCGRLVDSLCLCVCGENTEWAVIPSEG